MRHWGWFGKSAALLMLLTGAALAPAAPPADPFPFLPAEPLRLGSTALPREAVVEILMHAPYSVQDAASAKEFLRSRRPLIGGIVLCRRAGISLSPEATAQSLQRQDAMAGAEQKLAFRARQQGISMAELLKRESHRPEVQLTVALREWYRRTYGETAAVTDALVEDYYRHNQLKFRYERLQLGSILASAVTDADSGREKLQQWSDRLRQGEPFSRLAAENDAEYQALGGAMRFVAEPAVREAFSSLGKSDYRSGNSKIGVTELPDCIVLLDLTRPPEKGYLPLDAALKEAIREQLYDGLARGRLEEALVQELVKEEMVFAF